MLEKMASMADLLSWKLLYGRGWEKSKALKRKEE
jgi:hypothetical protein